jgi:glycosyltransferase involved in cell wall biosynthesis
MTPLKFAISGILGTLTVNGFIEREMNNQDIETLDPIDTVSIVIPSFNEEAFIKRCLSSIKGQSILQEHEDMFEIILVDNNSTDKTVEIGSRYTNKTIINPIKGKLVSRNLGISVARGNIIVAADADCYYPPFWLNTLLEPFNNLNGIYDHISGTSGSIFNPNIPGIPSPLYNISQYLNKKFVDMTNMSGANSAFWKHKYYQIGRFNENINQMDIGNMHQEEEINFGKNLSKLGEIIFKLNASCWHLGGSKTGCRIGSTSKDICDSYGIGIQRFG